MIETLTYNNNWLVRRHYQDGKYSVDTTYRLEKYNRYYKDVTDDSCFIADIIETIHYFDTNETIYKTEKFGFINESSYRIIKTDNNTKSLNQYNGRPPIAFKKN